MVLKLVFFNYKCPCFSLLQKSCSMKRNHHRNENVHQQQQNQFVLFNSYVYMYTAQQQNRLIKLYLSLQRKTFGQINNIGQKPIWNNIYSTKKRSLYKLKTKSKVEVSVLKTTSIQEAHRIHMINTQYTIVVLFFFLILVYTFFLVSSRLDLLQLIISVYLFYFIAK